MVENLESFDKRALGQPNAMKEFSAFSQITDRFMCTEQIRHEQYKVGKQAFVQICKGNEV